MISAVLRRTVHVKPTRIPRISSIGVSVNRQHWYPPVYNNVTCLSTVPSSSSSSNNNNDNKPNSNLIVSLSQLSKFKLSALVVSTTSFGFLAHGVDLSASTLLYANLGTALCASSASAYNQIIEVDRDRRMKRTSQRPLVTGAISPPQAVALATTWGVLGGGVLLYGTDGVTAGLGVANIALYAGLYTATKPVWEGNTWVGAVVGALPPVMGWTAAGGSVWDVEALLLGGTLFLWQFPHFFALSWMHRKDYKRGGFQMVPVNDPHGDRTSHLITKYTCYLATLPFLSSIAGVTSPMFAIEGIFLNAYALHKAMKFQKDRTNANARKVFLTSLWYLPCWMILFTLHSKTWRNEQEDENNLPLFHSIQHHINNIRNKGKQLCLHEQVTMSQSNNHQSDNCPLIMGKKKAETVKHTSIQVAEVGLQSVAAAATTTTTSVNCDSKDN